MLIGIGKHSGKSVEELVIKEPKYVEWLLYHHMNGYMAVIKKEVIRLIQILDTKPFTSKCCNCGSPAHYVTFCEGGRPILSWCNECDIRSIAIIENFETVTTYKDVLRRAEGGKGYRKQIMLIYLTRKGLPQRVGKKQAAEFFIIAETDDTAETENKEQVFDS